VADHYYSYIDHSVRYVLKATEGYVTALKDKPLGYTKDVRNAGVFLKHQLLPVAKQIRDGTYEMILWGETK